MATSRELLKAQANGAEIRVIATGIPVKHNPRYKGDRSPWMYREGYYTYEAARCVAVFPEPETVEAAPVVEIRIPAGEGDVKLDSEVVRTELRDDMQHAEYRRGLRKVRETQTLADNAKAAMEGVNQVRELIQTVRREYPSAHSFQPSHDENKNIIGYTFKGDRTTRTRYGWVTLSGRRCNALEDYRFYAARMLPYAVAAEKRGN